MNSTEFLKLWLVDRECPEGAREVHDDSEIDGKWVVYSTTYAVSDKLFTIHYSRSNAGYWGDSELCNDDDVCCHESELKEVTTVIYVKKV